MGASLEEGPEPSGAGARELSGWVLGSASGEAEGVGVGVAVGAGVGVGVGVGVVSMGAMGRASSVAAGASGPAGVTSTGIHPMPPR